MGQMWAGRFQKALSEETNDFNSSISFDCRMYKNDIIGSIAHATMLGKQEIISKEDSELIVKTLKEILGDIESEKLPFNEKAEDIHMFIEEELTNRIGVVGKRLHTARSRNDQVALDIRMTIKDEIVEIKVLLKILLDTLIKISKENTDTIMCGYTHLQRAQPITFAHHIMAYVQMFSRDIDRLSDCYKRVDVMPLGSGALASTTYNINREMVAEELGFLNVTNNSLDGVSDRDFCIELLSDLSIIMMHFSRFCEEIIMWCSWEFKYIELDDAYATGSSIMPQKKNPDIAELIRGKTGRVYGGLITLLTVMKGIPLAYNKDMQEDKEAVFNSVDTVKLCIKTFIPMIETMTVLKENMLGVAKKGFMNATDCADYLVKNGMAFREAYKITGELVAVCIEKNTTLEDLPLDEYKKISNIFTDEIYKAIDLEACVQGRGVTGGTSKSAVLEQIRIIEEKLNNIGIL